MHETVRLDPEAMAQPFPLSATSLMSSYKNRRSCGLRGIPEVPELEMCDSTIVRWYRRQARAAMKVIGEVDGGVEGRVDARTNNEEAYVRLFKQLFMSAWMVTNGGST